MNSIGFLALSDAAWASHIDGNSQGGYMVLAVHQRAFADKVSDFSFIDWRSFKLARVSRSSLNAETQAAAEAADALELTKVFWNLIRNPDKHLLSEELRTDSMSAIVIDAKSLYDAMKKEAVVHCPYWHPSFHYFESC